MCEDEITLEVESLGELVQNLQEEIVMLPQQVSNGLLAQAWTVSQESGNLDCLRLLIHQLDALHAHGNLLAAHSLRKTELSSDRRRHLTPHNERHPFVALWRVARSSGKGMNGKYQV